MLAVTDLHSVLCCNLLVAAAICRPDRAIFAATSYVANALGRKFVEPPVLDLGETLADSTPLSPLIFVLSAGVDPTQILRKLALERSMGSKFFTVAKTLGLTHPHLTCSFYCDQFRNSAHAINQRALQHKCLNQIRGKRKMQAYLG